MSIFRLGLEAAPVRSGFGEVMAQISLEIAFAFYEKESSWLEMETRFLNKFWCNI